MRLKEVLEGKLNEKEERLLRQGFDTVGDIAIIEIPKELVKKERVIAQAVLKQHKNVKVVAKKLGGHEGKYRVQKVKILAGVKRTETVHKESGVICKLGVAKCYFSPRLGTERMRIAKQVKPEEKVLVMFSGVGIYPLIMAKHSQAKKIVGIEINPTAHKYAQENMLLNKAGGKIVLYKGDVRKVAPKIKERFDRIIMPLPKTAITYLDLAFKLANKKAVIHLYAFAREGKFDEVKEIVGKKLKKGWKVKSVTPCGQTRAREWRVCVGIVR